MIIIRVDIYRIKLRGTIQPTNQPVCIQRNEIES